MTERWKPKYNDEYFFVECDGKVKDANWDDCEFDQRCFATGNCFKTKEEAEYAAEKIKALLLSLQPEIAKLPKLTAEVFDRPDCPEWAQYAVVDKDG